MLLTEQSFKVFPKHKGCGFTSEPFALIWSIFVALTKFFC